jgi:ribonuclease VapC
MEQRWSLTLKGKAASLLKREQPFRRECGRLHQYPSVLIAWRISENCVMRMCEYRTRPPNADWDLLETTRTIWLVSLFWSGWVYNLTEQKVVVDSSAVLAWLLGEPGRETVEKLLPVAIAPASVIVEVIYRAGERGLKTPPERIYEDLLNMGLVVEPFLASDALRAAELIANSRRQAKKSKTDRSLSLGDGLCIAVAERLELPVTGGDTHWEECDLPVEYFPFRA